ncbi:MAG: ABC-type transport auxiliary lipoprotein family protein [bacterium]
MKKLSAVIIAIILIGTTGCSIFSSSAPAKHYYQIYYTPAKTLGKKIAGTVRIKTFETDKIYRIHNIVKRKSQNEIQYYTSHFWASRPTDMVTDQIAKHVSEIELFSDVIMQLDRRPDFVLTGRILALDLVDSDEKWFARAALVFELRDYKSDRTVIAHSFDIRKEVPSKRIVHVVRVIGEIIEKEAETFFNKIYESMNID